MKKCLECGGEVAYQVYTIALRQQRAVTLSLLACRTIFTLAVSTQIQYVLVCRRHHFINVQLRKLTSTMNESVTSYRSVYIVRALCAHIHMLMCGYVVYVEQKKLISRLDYEKHLPIIVHFPCNIRQGCILMLEYFEFAYGRKVFQSFIDYYVTILIFVIGMVRILQNITESYFMVGVTYTFLKNQAYCILNIYRYNAKNMVYTYLKKC